MKVSVDNYIRWKRYILAFVMNYVVIVNLGKRYYFFMLQGSNHVELILY